jgi:hypothetical protein
MTTYKSLRGNIFGINRDNSSWWESDLRSCTSGEQCHRGALISPAVNDSTIEINESVKPLVEVAKEDMNKTVVAHHPHAPAQTYIAKKYYAAIVSYYVLSFPLLLHLLS